MGSNISKSEIWFGVSPFCMRNSPKWSRMIGAVLRFYCSEWIRTVILKTGYLRKHTDGSLSEPGAPKMMFCHRQIRAPILQSLF